MLSFKSLDNASEIFLSLISCLLDSILTQLPQGLYLFSKLRTLLSCLSLFTTIYQQSLLGCLDSPLILSLQPGQL